MMPAVAQIRSAFASSVPWLIGALTAAIFVADTLTDLEIAVSAFYVAVVLLTGLRYSERSVVTISVLCGALTVLSYFLTPRGAREAGIINGAIGLVAIAATTYLTLKAKQAEKATIDARTQLARVGRLTVLGELTASIAHEINQPLAAIVTNGGACMRWLAMQPPDMNETRQSLARIARDANRASEIVARVRAMASASPPAETWLSVNEAIREVLTVLRTEIAASQVTIHLNLDANLPVVLADRVQLQQVLVNLVMNAIEAMVDGEQREIAVSSTLDRSAGYLRIAVQDTGRGLDRQHAEQIFEPFFTTKASGIGMGLAISRTIVEAHGGRISAAPATPTGTVVQVTLPLARTRQVASWPNERPEAGT
jgi:C4-dicarboxylate-specific signal transduction histidine kinase